MQLSYRGVGYDPASPDVDLTESGLSGSYRNQALTFKYPRHIPTSQPVVELLYRAVAYRTTPDGGVESLPNPPKPDHAQSCTLRHPSHAISEASAAHRQAILTRLQHRLRTAQERGDAHLVQQLEAELQQVQ